MTNWHRGFNGTMHDKIGQRKRRFDISKRLHHDAAMRTTVDLPEDLHQIVTSLAAHTRASFSETAAELIQRGLDSPSSPRASEPALRIDAETGWPVFGSTRTITLEDVKALEDGV